MWKGKTGGSGSSSQGFQIVCGGGFGVGFGCGFSFGFSCCCDGVWGHIANIIEQLSAEQKQRKEGSK